MKQSLDYLTFSLRHQQKTNIHALSGIIEVDETFFLEFFKEKLYIPYKKLENIGKENIK
ncbi:MAG: hypothetical protein ACEY3J_03540 [Arsenophonus sp.]